MTQQPYSEQPYSQPRPSPARQLRRSRTDRKIAGICGGIGEYFGTDATLVRIAFVGLTVLTGGGFVLAYLLALIIMPDTPPAA